MKKTVRTAICRATRGKNGVRNATGPGKHYRPSDAVAFPQACGKTLADVYVTTDPEFSTVTLTFADKTELVVEVEPRLTFSADYSDWKTGDQRIIRRWRRIRGG